ncbi:hypothetical protein TKK_0002025 [Trichogramma kaykai]
MRRPLVRHLSEGGGGDGPRRQSIRPDDGDVATTWGCRDYRRHQSSSDLLKVPFGGRGRFSPEPKITSLFHGRIFASIAFSISTYFTNLEGGQKDFIELPDKADELFRSN